MILNNQFQLIWFWWRWGWWFTGDINFKYLHFAGDEYDGEHIELFCDSGGGDADIWFVACSAFSSLLHPQKGGNIFVVL